MRFEDEKDYIMRMIKEMVSVLFSILLGKQYVSVDEERKNGYEVSGTDLNDLLDMIIRTKKSWMVRNRYCKKRDMGIS